MHNFILAVMMAAT